MRIGIDARPLQGETRFRGIGKTEEFCLKSMAGLPDAAGHLFVFYIDSVLPEPEILQLFANRKIIGVKSPRLGQKRYFRSFLPSSRPARPQQTDVDVFLQFDAALGIPSTVPTVAVFYDLIPWLFRDKEKKDTSSLRTARRLKNELAGQLYWQKYMRFLRSFRNATHLLAISQSSRDDLLKHFPDIKGDKVSVLPLGVDDSFFERAKDPSPTIRLLAKKPYILYVGGIDTRKNITELVRVLYSLKNTYPAFRLVVVGKEFSLQDQLTDRGWFDELYKNETYMKDVVTAGFVSHDDLLYLYSHAACFVFPSLYEGFGLPILEAMAAGCPVVAYKTSSLPEVAGNAGILIDPGISLAEPVGKLLSNQKKITLLRSAGKKHAKNYTWDKTSSQLLNALEKYGRAQ